MPTVRLQRPLVAALTAVTLVAMLGVFAVVSVGSNAFDGTNVTERDLSPEDQRALIDAFSPVPIPPEASGIRLKYQRFQDWYFEASFDVPPEQLAAFVGGLEPTPTRDRYVGKRIGPHVGVVLVDAATGRVTVRHVSA